MVKKSGGGTLKLVALSFAGILVACQTTSRSTPNAPYYSAQITKNGKLQCFTEEFMNAQEKPPRCEISAVETIDGQLVFGSDKDIPNASSIFSYTSSTASPQGLPQNYFNHPKILNATKFEAMAKISDESIILVSTAFDRTRPGGDWDKFNNLVAWRMQDPATVQIIQSQHRSDATSSVELREVFRKALKQADYPLGPPYFKIEGMTYLPGGTILFGIRETGARYDDFNFHRWIIAGKLKGAFPALTLDPNLETILDFSNHKIPDITEPLGISSLAFDPVRDGVWILTSYETEATDEGVGGYLWFISLDKLLSRSQGAPTLIRTPQGAPLHFAHKSEGLTVLRDGRLFVVHDDDRVTGRTDIKDPSRQFSRRLNESFYSVVEISTSSSK